MSKGFCSVLHAKKVRYMSRYPSIALSKITIDTPFCWPSITFHTCLISFPGDQESENGMGTGGLIFRTVSHLRPQAYLHLKAEGPMYWRPHRAAKARIARARNSKLALTKPTIRAMTASAGRNLSNITPDILILVTSACPGIIVTTRRLHSEPRWAGSRQSKGVRLQ